MFTDLSNVYLSWVTHLISKQSLCFALNGFEFFNEMYKQFTAHITLFRPFAKTCRPVAKIGLIFSKMYGESPLSAAVLLFYII